MELIERFNKWYDENTTSAQIFSTYKYFFYGDSRECRKNQLLASLVMAFFIGSSGMTVGKKCP